jgi:hypothetical protein
LYKNPPDIVNSHRTVPITIYVIKYIYITGLAGCDTISEEGSETINSMVILAVFIGVAFVAAAMAPADNASFEEFNPLEVNKAKLTGPAVLVFGNQGNWELQISVVNNLDVCPEEVEDPPDDDVDDEPNIYFVSTSTRGDTDDVSGIRIVDTNTITDVVVSDVLPAEFTLTDYTPSQGTVSLTTNEDGSTSISWSVGDLAPKAKATLDMEVKISASGFSKPGTYVLNSGASASGMQFSTKEMLSDGPTKSILVSVIDGTPNAAPVAEAGVHQIAFEGNPVYLDGQKSYDPDGSIVSYEWYIGDEEIGNEDHFLTYLDVGEYEVTLVVTDDGKATSEDTVPITIYEDGTNLPGSSMVGTVRDATTRRGFDPYIEVWNEDFAISTWTDMGGNYRIIGIPAGNYEVYCESEGYRDHFGEISITEDGEYLYDIDMFRE